MTQIHFLTKNPRGRHALLRLLAPPASGNAEDPELEIDASVMRVADAFTATMAMANVEHHLAQPGGRRRVTITPPRSGDVVGRFCTLLRLVPDDCEIEIPDGRTAPVLDPRVLLPAVRVRSIDEADALGKFFRASSQKSGLGPARLAPKEAGLFADAVPDLVQNGLQYGASSSCGVVICGALEADNREAQLVVTDLGCQLAPGEDALEGLREAWSHSREVFGTFNYLTDRAMKAGLDISLQIRTGNATGRWRNGRWNAEEGEFTPGWTTSLTLHR
jgi:hypothetical protein